MKGVFWSFTENKSVKLDVYKYDVNNTNSILEIINVLLQNNIIPTIIPPTDIDTSDFVNAMFGVGVLRDQVYTIRLPSGEILIKNTMLVKNEDNNFNVMSDVQFFEKYGGFIPRGHKLRDE